MNQKNNKIIDVSTRLLANGLVIKILGKDYAIRYPPHLWQAINPELKQIISDNIAYASTNFLPLILNKKAINYSFPLPVMETFFYKNQLFDLLDCEISDHRPHLSLLKKFYNLDFNFSSAHSAWLNPCVIPPFKQAAPTAIIPFTFGKESLLTFAVCRELGIRPILIYCQEPAHPHEQRYKLKKLKEFSQKFKVQVHYIKNEPGLFRYGLAFGQKKATEIGWGGQTTLLTLLALPFVYYYQAALILFGNEYSNNEIKLTQGWRWYPAGFDQTSLWTKSQNNISCLLTNNQCQVKSSLEPLEEISIFYTLHHRYPEIGKYQFSCSAQYPLKKHSAWCHRCYKCARIYLFALAVGLDPASIGFLQDLLATKNMFPHYFGQQHKSGSSLELDFAFYILHKKNIPSAYQRQFTAQKLPWLKPWPYYYKYFTSLKPSQNLPEKYQSSMLEIFADSLEELKKNLSA